MRLCRSFSFKPLSSSLYLFAILAFSLTKYLPTSSAVFTNTLIMHLAGALCDTLLWCTHRHGSCYQSNPGISPSPTLFSLWCEVFYFYSLEQKRMFVLRLFYLHADFQLIHFAADDRILFFFLFLKRLVLLECVYVCICMSSWMCTCVQVISSENTRMFLELELKVVVSCLMWD